MFRIDQIMTATQFSRSFRQVADYLSRNPEPLLITQKNGRFIVVMDGEFFQDLMDTRAEMRQDQSQLNSRNVCDFKS